MRYNQIYEALDQDSNARQGILFSRGDRFLVVFLASRLEPYNNV
jgi:hypothetical protein